MELKYIPNHRSYAMDLVDYAPKHGFMFVVEFEFNDAQSTQFNKVFTSLVQSTTLPNFKVDNEAVNMYGFRTHVAKTATWDPVKMTFLDDIKNHTFRAAVRLLNKMSPITNIVGSPELFEIQQNTELTGNVKQTKTVEDGTYSVNAYAGILGPSQVDLTSGAAGQYDVGILRSIRIWHVFNFGKAVNKYTLYNPKIVEIQFDELQMGVNVPEGHKVEMVFEYDTATFEPDISPTTANLPELVQGMTMQMVKRQSDVKGVNLSDQIQQNSAVNSFVGITPNVKSSIPNSLKIPIPPSIAVSDYVNSAIDGLFG